MCPIETLGERIRKLRKQRKLTLEALAGKELTKGMLSLIENNKANPSMESLNYIAEQLGVEASELLEEVSTQELREVLEKAEKLYHVENHDGLTDKYTRLINLVTPYIPKLTQGYEAARLLEMVSRCLYLEKRDDWQALSDRAAQIYEQMNIIPRRASIGIFRAMVKFVEHNYAESLEVMLKERMEIEMHHVYIDPMTVIDLDYHEAVLHYAVGDSVSAKRVMDNAIEFSKKHQVFYNINSLYRLAASHAMMTFDVKESKFYSKKLELYSEFAEDEDAFFFTRFLEIHYLNSFKKSYAEALELSTIYSEPYEKPKIYNPYLFLEIGKSLHGLNQYKDALISLEKVEIADHTHHPIDLSMLFEADAYIALCHMALGDNKNALHYAKKAFDNILPMPHSPYKDFITKTYELITTK